MSQVRYTRDATTITLIENSEVTWTTSGRPRYHLLSDVKKSSIKTRVVWVGCPYHSSTGGYHNPTSNRDNDIVLVYALLASHFRLGSLSPRFMRWSATFLRLHFPLSYPRGALR